MEYVGREFLQPFRNPAWPLGGIVCYLVVIFAMREWMKNRKAWELNTALAVHNGLLCVLSTAMSIGFVANVLHLGLNYGWLNGVYCGIDVSHKDLMSLFFWTEVFYVSKYYELLDTVFLVLRKKPLQFLHVYHHAIVLFVTWFATDEFIIMGIFLHFCIHIQDGLRLSITPLCMFLCTIIMPSRYNF